MELDTDFSIIYEKINKIKESQPDAVCIIKCKEFHDIEIFFQNLKNYIELPQFMINLKIKRLKMFIVRFLQI